MPKPFVAAIATLGLSLALAACYQKQKADPAQTVMTDWCSTTPAPNTAKIYPAANGRMLGPMEQQIVQFSSTPEFPYIPRRTWCGVRSNLIRPMLVHYVLACLIEIKSILVDPMTMLELFLNTNYPNDTSIILQNRDPDLIRVFTVWYSNSVRCGLPLAAGSAPAYSGSPARVSGRGPSLSRISGERVSAR